MARVAGVEIDLHIHLVATEDIVFDGVYAIALKGDTIFRQDE